MGHNMELYCTQPTVRRGVEKQIKLQQTCGMQIAERGRTRVCQPTRPLNRCKIFDSELATVQRGEERCSLLETGRGRVWGQWMEFSTMLGPLFPHILCFSPTSAWNGRCGDFATEPSGKTSGRHFLRTFPHLGDNKPPTTVRGGDRKGETLWCGRSYVFADR